MEMVLSNGFCEMTQDEMRDLEGGFDLGSISAGWLGTKIGTYIGGPIGGVVGGIIGVAVYECVTHYDR